VKRVPTWCRFSVACCLTPGTWSSRAQEREYLTVAGESAVRLRMKRSEASAKEQAMVSFLDRWRPKLTALMGPNLPPVAKMR